MEIPTINIFPIYLHIIPPISINQNPHPLCVPNYTDFPRVSKDKQVGDIYANWEQMPLL